MLALIGEAGCQGVGSGQIRVNGMVNRKSRPAGGPVGARDPPTATQTCAAEAAGGVARIVSAAGREFVLMVGLRAGHSARLNFLPSVPLNE
ncbi:hypothetical protein [Burkholderia anthina]|uniref:hypothetical protein n=1 Tax=Burkholderia anthina TaxID=179879 RepID=UPI000F5E365B|nr:hypothetical protein [Burkholderia anthina]